MHHDTGLIALLAAGIGLAFGLGLLATRLRVPAIVGYVLAGVLIGPSTPGFTADAGLASQLSEVGVILLMFGVGIHFSIRDLLAARRIAVPGAIVQIAVATGLGLAVSHLWGWPWGAGIVLGLCLSVASTVVLLRALEERGVLDTVDGRVAIGWLIVEDLATVLVLVVLPPLAGVLGATHERVSGTDLLITVGRTALSLAVFVGLMYAVGRRAVPWLLERVARTGSRELFTLSVLAVALVIAVGASAVFGVSFALGAFLAGTVVNGSDLSHEAARDALPLQDAFSVLFFVAVGMIFDPSILLERPLQVVGVVAIIVGGKSLAAFAIVRAFGYPTRTALMISASLAQIGEFSFMLGALGVSLGILPAEGQSLIVAGAICSITLNPVAFWLAERAASRWAPAPARTDANTAVPELRDHAVIVGYGRVGHLVGRTLAAAGAAFIAIDEDRDLALMARERGTPIVVGDGSRLDILRRVGIERARLLVLATPEPFKARTIMERARSLHPAIEILARADSEDERRYVIENGARAALVAEQELAFALAHNALVGMGRDDDEADRAIARLRQDVAS
jgi:monovalent cation:H+ antiporter-2, CPA2 family